MVKLQAANCPLIVLGGNHDSVATLNESRELLACLNTHVIASAQLTPETQATLLYRRDGEPGAVLCPVPFLRPRDVLRSLGGQSGREKQQQLLEAISLRYQQSYEAACQLRGERNLPIIATGHLTTVGVTKSDAVRDIYIGTLDAFPADRFPPADYIALGHIHRAQKVAGCEHIRYSGSPIALSFDETGKEKSVYLVEFADGKLRDVTALPVPVSQPLAVLKGSLESITAQLEQWRDAPDEPKVWLDIEIDTAEFLHDMHRQISVLTESLPVEVVLLRRSREMRERALGTLSTETLSELGPEEVFERRLELEAFEEPEKARLRTLFARTLESLHEEDEA